MNRPRRNAREGISVELAPRSSETEVTASTTTPMEDTDPKQERKELQKKTPAEFSEGASNENETKKGAAGEEDWALQRRRRGGARKQPIIDPLPTKLKLSVVEVENNEAGGVFEPLPTADLDRLRRHLKYRTDGIVVLRFLTVVTPGEFGTFDFLSNVCVLGHRKPIRSFRWKCEGDDVNEWRECQTKLDTGYFLDLVTRPFGILPEEKKEKKEGSYCGLCLTKCSSDLKNAVCFICKERNCCAAPRTEPALSKITDPVCLKCCLAQACCEHLSASKYENKFGELEAIYTNYAFSQPAHRSIHMSLFLKKLNEWGQTKLEQIVQVMEGINDVWDADIVELREFISFSDLMSACLCVRNAVTQWWYEARVIVCSTKEIDDEDNGIGLPPNLQDLGVLKMFEDVKELQNKIENCCKTTSKFSRESFQHHLKSQTVHALRKLGNDACTYTKTSSSSSGDGKKVDGKNEDPTTSSSPGSRPLCTSTYNSGESSSCCSDISAPAEDELNNTLKSLFHPELSEVPAWLGLKGKDGTDGDVVAISESDVKQAAKALSLKLLQVADLIEKSDFAVSNSSHFNLSLRVQDWPRVLCARFLPKQSVSVAPTAISAVFLCSLTHPPFFSMINEALRTNNEKALQVLNPIVRALDIFCNRFPGVCKVRSTGHSCRSLRQLMRVGENPTFAAISSRSDIALFHDSITMPSDQREKKSGTILIVIGEEMLWTEPFCSSENETKNDWLLGRDHSCKTIYHVPFNHLTKLNQRSFDIAVQYYTKTEEEISFSFYGASAATVEVRETVATRVEAWRRAMWAYKGIQEKFVEPSVIPFVWGEPQDSETTSSIGLYTAVKTFLDVKSSKRWMALEGGPGMGKSVCGVQIASLICCASELIAVDEDASKCIAVVISLPQVADHLFTDDGIEPILAKMLHLDDVELAVFRMTQRLLLVLDSLDKVCLPSSSWPQEVTLGRSLSASRWPRLRVIVTCNEECLVKQNHLVDFAHLLPEKESDRLVGYRIQPQSTENTMKLVKLFQPRNSEKDFKCISEVYERLQNSVGATQGSTFLLLLIGKARQQFESVEELADLNIFSLYEHGILGWIRSNMHNAGKDPAVHRELLQCAMDWSMRLAVAMFLRSYQYCRLGMLPEILDDHFAASPYTPELLFSVAPISFDMNSSVAFFEFQDRSVQDFFVARAALGITSTPFVDKIWEREKQSLFNHIDQNCNIRNFREQGKNFQATSRHFSSAFHYRARVMSQDRSCSDLFQHLNEKRRLVSFSASIDDVQLAENINLHSALFVDLSGSSVVDDRSFFNLRNFRLNCDLIHFSVSRTFGKISDDLIYEIAKHCPRLQYLDVSHTRGKIGDASITEIASQCPLLRHLDVSSTKGAVTDASISLIAAQCPLLRYLNVSGTDGKITDASLTLIAKNCPDLDHLDVSDTKGRITDESICAIVTRCYYLQHLNVSRTHGSISDTSISTLARQCPNIQFLDVSRTCGKISDTSITDLVKHGANLRYLDVNHTAGKSADISITDASISLVARHSLHIQHLDISWTSGYVSDVSLLKMVILCPQQLEFLDVSWTGGWITDDALTELAKQCPRLRHLNVSWTGGWITDDSIFAIAEHCPRLQCLNIRSSCDIRDAAICEIAKNCAELEQLDVSWTDGKVTDFSISEIAKHCPRLQYLDVSHTRGKIGDASITEIASQCPLLRHLDVSSTKGAVTDASMSLIAVQCPLLRYLNVSGTDGKITDASLTLIAKSCPDLEELAGVL